MCSCQFLPQSSVPRCKRNTQHLSVVIILWLFVSSPNNGTNFIQQLIFESILCHYALSSPKMRPSFIQQPIVKSILGHYVPEEEEEFVERKHEVFVYQLLYYNWIKCLMFCKIHPLQVAKSKFFKQAHPADLDFSFRHTFKNQSRRMCKKRTRGVDFQNNPMYLWCIFSKNIANPQNLETFLARFLHLVLVGSFKYRKI